MRKTPAQIIAEAVSSDDRRGRHQKPQWRYLGLAERERLWRDTEAGLFERYGAGINYDLYVSTLYGGAASEEFFGCVTRDIESIIEVDPTPDLLKLFAADILPCGCPRRVVIDEGHQEGCPKRVAS